MTGPKTIEAGVAEITLKNSTKEGGGIQLIRVEGDHTKEEVFAKGEAWGDKNKPLPEWLFLEGGVPNTAPGKSDTVTQTLKPGKYYAADLESNGAAEIEVTGDGKGEVEAPAATIDATEYSFKASGLKAGKSEVLFDNKGGQPHFVVGLPINEGKTIGDVKSFLKEEKGKPPFTRAGQLRHRGHRGRRQAGGQPRPQEGQVRPGLLHPRPPGRPAPRGQGDGLRGDGRVALRVSVLRARPQRAPGARFDRCGWRCRRRARARRR